MPKNPHDDAIARLRGERAQRRAVEREKLVQANLTYDQLLDRAAELALSCNELMGTLGAMNEFFSNTHKALDALSDCTAPSSELLRLELKQGNLMAHYMIQAIKSETSKKATHNARIRHAADPKHADKEFVLQCWRDWQRQPGRYRSKAAFARDMLDKCEHLTSQKKIEDWCREWEKSEPC